MLYNGSSQENNVLQMVSANKQIKHLLFLGVLWFCFFFPRKAERNVKPGDIIVRIFFFFFFCELVEGQLNLSVFNGQNMPSRAVVVKVTKGQRNMPFFSSSL